MREHLLIFLSFAATIFIFFVSFLTTRTPTPGHLADVWSRTELLFEPCDCDSFFPHHHFLPLLAVDKDTGISAVYICSSAASIHQHSTYLGCTVLYMYVRLSI